LDVNNSGSLGINSGRLVSARTIAVTSSGSLVGGSGTIGFSGDFSQQGSFSAGTGSVRITDGCGVTTSTITGANSFYDFYAHTATGHILIFPADQTQSIAHSLNLSGEPGALLKIRSSTANVASNLALADGAAQSIAYVNVADNHVTAQHIGQGSAGSFHSVNAGNSNGWFRSNYVPGAPPNPPDSAGLIPVLMLLLD
jgi:hypothetical protein